MKTPLLLVISVSLAKYFIEEKKRGRCTNISTKAKKITIISVKKTIFSKGTKCLTAERIMITADVMSILIVVRQCLSGAYCFISNQMEQKLPDDIADKASRQIICTPSPSAKNTFFYVQEAGYSIKDEASVYHKNNLDSFLIAAVISGFGELMVRDDTFPLIKGDCFFVDCCQPYYYKSSEAEPWELLWIHFNGSSSQQYYEFFTSQSKAWFH